jgi:hypothetical protein
MRIIKLIELPKHAFSNCRKHCDDEPMEIQHTPQMVKHRLTEICYYKNELIKQIICFTISWIRFKELTNHDIYCDQLKESLSRPHD